MNAIVKSSLLVFPNVGPGNDMPLCLDSERPGYTGRRTYTLNADVATDTTTKKRYLKFYLTDSLPNNYASTDESLDMRVRENSLITLNIDSTLQARFDLARSSPLQLGAATGAPQGVQNSNTRYVAVRGDFQDKSLRFYAKREGTLVGGKPVLNKDALTICIVLDQYMADNTTLSSVPLSLLIDPGIKNPGDDTIAFDLDDQAASAAAAAE